MATLAGSGLLGEEHNYRETVSVWFRSLFVLQPDVDAMAAAPWPFHVHVLVGDAPVRHVAVHPARARVHRPAALPVPPLHRLPEPRRPIRARQRSRRLAAGIPWAPKTETAEEPPMIDHSSPAGRAHRADAPARPGHPGLRASRSGPGTSSPRSGCSTPKTFGLSSGQKALLVATPGAGRVAGPHRHRRPHRPLRRAAHVHRPVLRLHRTGAPRRLRRQPRLLRAAPRRRPSSSGIAGTTFAVGIPFVNAWFDAVEEGLRHRRLRRGHGRHRALGLLHAAVREVVRLHRRPT